MIGRNAQIIRKAKFVYFLSEVFAEAQCSSTVGHRLWMILYIWDAHMAVVRRRPMVTYMQLDSFAHSITDDKERRRLVSRRQIEQEPAGPSDAVMTGCIMTCQCFQDIHYLQHCDTNPGTTIRSKTLTLPSQIFIFSTPLA